MLFGLEEKVPKRKDLLEINKTLNGDGSVLVVVAQLQTLLLILFY